MRIAVVGLYDRNEPEGTDLAAAVAAVQRQVTQDFAPVWGYGATLSLHRATLDGGPIAALAGVDGIVYVAPSAEVRDAGELGLPRRKKQRSLHVAAAFHARSYRGVPVGFVVPPVAATAEARWTRLLSHEILEMIVDPDVNLLVAAPHPKSPKRIMLVPYEICDPVQASHYERDGVEVSNFVTPLYFKQRSHWPGGSTRTNFLDEALAPFGVLKHGYYRYFDTRREKWATYPDKQLGPWARARKQLGALPRSTQRRGMADEWQSLALACICEVTCAC